jgi:hypothetical protein
VAGSLALTGQAEPGTTVELWVGEALLAAVPVDADGNWSYSGELEPGDYAIVARNVTAQGEVLEESEPLAVTVTAPEAPAAVLNEPQTGADGALVLSGSGVPGTTVELWIGDTKLAGVPVDAEGNWSYSGSLEPGDYEVVAKTINAAGEVVAESEAMPVTVAALATAADVLNEPQIGAEGALELSGAGEPGSTVEIWAGDTLLATVPVADDGTWSYSGQPQPGDYEVVVRNVDAEGELVAESEPLPVSVSAEGEVAVESPAAPPEAAAGAGVTMNEPQAGEDGTLTLSGSGQPGSTIEIVDNGEVVATVVVAKDGAWTVDYAAPEGDHSLAVQVPGDAGASSAPVQVSVSESPPVGGYSYVVLRGDWLKKIARDAYGNSNRWGDIVEATNAKAKKDPSYHRIKNPDFIMSGWKLWIPQE